MLLSACASPLRVDNIANVSFANEPKMISLITRTRYDADIRRALVKQGFKIKRFVSVKRIEDQVSEKRKEQYDQAEVKFALSVFPGQRVDYCIGPAADQLGRAVFELSNLSTNDIVLYVEGGGWTHPCGSFHTDLVWDKLSKALAKEWK